MVEHSHEPGGIYLQNISKKFGFINANKNISIRIKKYGITGIIGENGAGKSTLVRILSGFYKADSGKIFVDGKRTTLGSCSEALSLGIAMVYQHFMLVPDMSVPDNILIGSPGSLFYQQPVQVLRLRLLDLITQHGFSLDPDSKIKDLSVGLRQQVEILKTLFRGTEFLILDEPTGVLSPQETERFFKLLKELKNSGVTIVLITHKLNEVVAVTDYVYVMRAGCVSGEKETSKTNPRELAELMMGKNLVSFRKKKKVVLGEQRLKVSKLGYIDRFGIEKICKVSFSLRAGEVLGLAGVSGNGQSELLQILSGMIPLTSGVVEYADLCLNSLKKNDSQDVRNAGVRHIPEDRHVHGLILDLMAYETSLLGQQNSDNILKNSFFSPNRLSEYCIDLMNEFDIRPVSPNLPTRFFSGGNQQKLIIARELSQNPKVLLIGQPTRGVDIGAVNLIYNRLLQLRETGCAILLVSADLDEILNLSDRILVMNGGSIVGDVINENIDRHEIGLMMGGVHQTGDI